MKRPLAYITASWGTDPTENAEIAAKYIRKVFEAGYNPICPMLMLSTFMDDGIPQEHKDRQAIELDYLRRSNVLVISGSRIDEAVKTTLPSLALPHPGNHPKRYPDHLHHEEPRAEINGT